MNSMELFRIKSRKYIYFLSKSPLNLFVHVSKAKHGTLYIIEVLISSISLSVYVVQKHRNLLTSYATFMLCSTCPVPANSN